MRKIFLAGLAAAWLPMARVLLNPSTALLYRDLSNLYIPAKSLWLRAVLELARIPHWNPFLAGGVPFFSDPTIGTFNPANLLLLLAPRSPVYGLMLMLAAHLLALYAGGFLLARELRVRPWLAMAAGLALAWSGYAATTLSNPHDLAGISAVPFFFAFLSRARKNKSFFSSLGAAGALAFPVLSGDAQISYVMGLLALLFCKKRDVILTVKVGIAAILLSSPQLLPTIDHFAETRRAGAQVAGDNPLIWSLHPARLVELLYPQPFGSRPDFGTYLGYTFSTSTAVRMDPFVFSFYPGLFVVAFGLISAFATLARRRRWRSVWNRELFAFLLLAALSLGSFTPFAALFARLVPLWGAFRYPERLTFWLAFLAWIPAARGSEKTMRLVALGRRVPWIPIALYVPGAIAVAWWSTSAGSPAVLISLAALVAFSIVLELGARRVLAPEWIAPLCAIVLSCEAGFVTTRLVWAMPAAIAQPGFSQLQSKLLRARAEARAEERLGGAFRLYSLGQVLFDEGDPAEILARRRFGTMERETRKAWANLRYYTGATFGFELAHQHSALVPTRPIYELERKSPQLLNRFLDLASVRYLVLENRHAAVARLSALPYAFFPPYIEETPEPQAAVERMSDDSWNPRETALIEGAGPRRANGSCWRVADVARSWDHITLRLSSSAGCATWLLVNEAYDRGWTARIEGAETAEIRRANTWAQAIRLPASRASEITLSLEYRERSFLPGCALFLLGIVMLLPAQRRRSRADLGAPERNRH